MVAAGAGNLIGQDGASLVGAGGINLQSAHTGNVIQLDGLKAVRFNGVPNKF